MHRIPRIPRHPNQPEFLQAVIRLIKERPSNEYRELFSDLDRLVCSFSKTNHINLRNRRPDKHRDGTQQGKGHVDMMALLAGRDTDLYLEAVSLDVNNEFTRESLATSRNTFFNELRSSEIHVKFDSKEETVRFSLEESVDITNFFFSDLMGGEVYNRLQLIVDQYDRLGPREAKEDSSKRDSAVPGNEIESIVEKFSSIYHYVSSANRQAQSGLDTLYRVQDHIELLGCVNRLRTMISEKHQDLTDYLHRQGYAPKQGVGWQSLLIRFLADRVDISPSRLQNLCHTAQGVTRLTMHFGSGVIPLLPPSALTKLSRWGYQRMDPVYAMLHNAIPFMLPIFNLLSEHMYIPIRDGELITIHLRTAGSQPLLLQDVLQTAMSEHDKYRIHRP